MHAQQEGLGHQRKKRKEKKNYASSKNGNGHMVPHGRNGRMVSLQECRPQGAFSAPANGHHLQQHARVLFLQNKHTLATMQALVGLRTTATAPARHGPGMPHPWDIKHDLIHHSLAAGPAARCAKNQHLPGYKGLFLVWES